jgi:Ni,Fe-hydrogenase I large subunit
MPSRCVYMHSPLPNTQFFNHNAFAKERKRNKAFIPDLLSTLSAAWKYSWHWFCRWQQPFQQIGGLGRELIESNGRDTLLYLLKDVLICTIKEQCSDNENIHETDRTTVKTLYLIIYMKVTGCILRIHLWRNERQRNVNNFSSCKSGYQNVN